MMRGLLRMASETPEEALCRASTYELRADENLR